MVQIKNEILWGLYVRQLLGVVQVALVSLTLIQVKISDCVVTHCYVITAWKESR